MKSSTRYFKILASCFLFLTVSCSGSSQDSKEQEAQDKKVTIDDKVVESGQSLFWKIEGENLQQPSYIFGTMHLINKEYFVMGDSLKKRLEMADALMMEIGDLNPLAAMGAMQLKEGHVKDFFSPEQYDSILVYVEENASMNREMFDQVYGKMKPFAIMQIITQSQFEGNPESYELTFQTLAKENEKEILGLETINEQLGFFDEIPKEDMAEMIMEAIRDTSEDGTTEKMMQLYSEQKTDELLPFMLESSPEMMEFEELLLTGRNKKWIPLIEEAIQDKMVFIAVGAAHLLGDEGVIELLKKEGYTLTPISTE